MNHCQRCGACCATYRISLHRDEVDDTSAGRVPAGLVESLTAQLVCMRGTVASARRCIALRGTIGDSVSCGIYEFRPEACREFAPLAAVGSGDEACDQARRRHGLPPLRLAAS